MGIILIFLVLIIAVAILIDSAYSIWPIFWSTFISVAILGFILLISWGTYVDQKTFYEATRGQYTEAIEMYDDHAVLDLKQASFTDLKYQGYQENVATFIKDLRNKVIGYNEGITSKRIYEGNFFFNWLIIAPDDDMKIIKMKGE